MAAAVIRWLVSTVVLVLVCTMIVYVPDALFFEALTEPYPWTDYLIRLPVYLIAIAIPIVYRTRVLRAELRHANGQGEPVKDNLGVLSILVVVAAIGLGMCGYVLQAMF